MPNPYRLPASLAAACLIGAAGCDDGVQSRSSGKRVFSPVFSSSPARVMDFLAEGGGGTRAKLVYVDRTGEPDRLAFVDFSDPAGTVKVIAAAARPAVPVISPDGGWVVYASGEGAEAGSPVSARSSVYLVRLAEDAVPILVAADSACEPRFVQDVGTGSGKFSIIYSTLAPNLAWEGFGKTMQVDVDLAGASPSVGAPRVLVDHGSYTGGLSWDGRYLTGGGGHVAMLDRQGDKGRPDTLSYDMIQSCNASISSSRVFTDHVMYLNTEGSSDRIEGGAPWGEWQAILVSDHAGNLVRGYSIPKAFGHPLETAPEKSLTKWKWHHNEWSNHPHFAAATVNAERYFKAGDAYANTLYQERIYAINLRDSTYLEIIRPDRIAFGGKNVDVSGFYWPWLWVEVPEGFAESGDWLK